MFSSASFTLIANAAERSGTTANDERENFLLADTERVPDSRTVLAEGLRDGWHRELALLSPEQSIDGGAGLGLSGIGQVQIDHRGLQTAVAEILLDDFQ